MFYLRSIALVVLILLINSNFTFADTGCLYNNYVYTYDYGTYFGNPPGATYGNGYYPRYDYLNSNERVLQNSVFCTQSSSQPCRVTGSVVGWGTLINFSITHCSIDNYAPFLILFILISGVNHLKERKSVN